MNLERISMRDETRFFNKITIVSFWLAICVVYIHANNTLTYHFAMDDIFAKSVYIFENWAQGWQQCAVPLFFMISGFLFFRNYALNRTLSKWKKRAKILLVPYLVWTQVPWILLSLVKLTPYGKFIGTEASFSIKSWVEFVLFCNGTVLWYVRATMIFVLLSPLIYLLMRVKKGSLIIIVTIVIINCVLCAKGIATTEELYWCPPFLLGAWFAIWKPDFFISRTKAKNYRIAMCVFAVLLVFAINSKYTLHTPLTQYLYKMSLPLPLWYALDIFEFKRKPKWVETLSFPIYCTHAIILEMFEKVIYVLGGNSIWIAAISYIFTPIVVVFLLVVCMYWCRRTLSLIHI